MCVDLTQRSSSDLGSFLWPSCLLLSDFIHHNMRDRLQGKTVLEVRSVKRELMPPMPVVTWWLTLTRPAHLASCFLRVAFFSSVLAAV